MRNASPPTNTPAGTSAIIKVHLRSIYKSEDFGNWSAWQQWTLTEA